MDSTISSQLQAYRLKCYRTMLLKDLEEDYSIQNYHTNWHNSQDAVNKLFTYLEANALTPEERVELLLTIFVSLQLGFRNSALFNRATDIAFSLLPLLSPQNHLYIHLIIHLYLETNDEDLRNDAETLMAEWESEEQTEEDEYLLEFYAPVRCEEYAITAS